MGAFYWVTRAETGRVKWGQWTGDAVSVCCCNFSAGGHGEALQSSGPEVPAVWTLGVERDELGDCSVTRSFPFECFITAALELPFNKSNRSPSLSDHLSPPSPPWLAQGISDPSCFERLLPSERLWFHSCFVHTCFLTQLPQGSCESDSLPLMLEAP